MEYIVRKKELTRRFVAERGIVEHTEQEIDDIGGGMDEKDFDEKRYSGKTCTGCAGCGYGECRQI